MFVTKIIRIFALFLILMGLGGPAFAQVPHPSNPPPASPYTTVDPATLPVADVTFFSHSFGENFPHAFIIMAQADPQGRIYYDAFGFSAKHLSPKILFGRVDGHIAVPGERYVRQSTPHFRLPITAEQKYRIELIRDRWTGARYHLNKQNCVHFIAELVEAVGLRINRNSEHFKEPKSFLEEVLQLNPGLQGSLQQVSNEFAR